MCSLTTEKPGKLYWWDGDGRYDALIQSVAAELQLVLEPVQDVSQLAYGELATHAGCLLVSDRMLSRLEQKSGRPITDLQSFSSGGRLNLVGRPLATIVICDHPDVRRIVSFMRAGARTVLPTPLDHVSLTQEIREAIECDRQRVQEEAHLQQLRQIYNGLAERKRCVLQHMIDGRASKWSAHVLDVSRRTIELDRAEILSAFGVSNAIELARLTTANRCLPLDYSHIPPHENCSLAFAK